MNEKNFLHLLTKPNGCAIMASQNKDAEPNPNPFGKLNFIFELMRTIPIFEFQFSILIFGFAFIERKFSFE